MTTQSYEVVTLEVTPHTATLPELSIHTDRPWSMQSPGLLYRSCYWRTPAALYLMVRISLYVRALSLVPVT